MGGAYGHLMHLHEDRDLTFAALKDVLRSAAAGRLERCTEKTDGMNLVFTWDESIGGARVARSVADIRRGGMGAAALAKKFADRPGNVAAAFEGAFRALSAALEVVPVYDRRRAFGDFGESWYSAEVISPSCPNVINYDCDRIVFHAHGSFYSSDNALVTSAEARGVDVLAAHAARMDAAAFGVGWRATMPQRAVVGCRADDLHVALSTISELQVEAHCTDSSTIADYAQQAASRIASGLRLPVKASEMVARRLCEASGAPTLTQIKKVVPANTYPLVSALAGAEDFDTLVRPLERAIHRFSIELLRGMQSAMVADHEAEVRRIRDAVAAALLLAEERGNDAARGLVRTHMSRLNVLADISSSAEGIVFRCGLKAYKLTGAFAPVNQILGLLRFGRGEARIGETSRPRGR